VKDQWEEQTESALGEREGRSFDLDIDFSTLPPPTAPAIDLSPKSALHTLWPEQRAEHRRADLIVFDPLDYQVARELRALGYPTREVRSGVDVMTGISDHPTAAVVCGPAEDGEQRRLLTAAIRLRFPEIPIVYASTHGRNPAAVRGAIAEGAHIVLPIPLPSLAEIDPILGEYIRPLEAPAPPTLAPDEPPQETLALGREELQKLLTPQGGRPTQVPPQPHRVPTVVPAPIPLEVVADPMNDFEAATELVEAPKLPVPPSPGPPQTARVPNTNVPTSTASGAIPTPEVSLRRGELGELLRAISPFLWGLDDAARYMDVRAAMGDVGAQGHQRTLKLLGNLLRQLQQRIDDSGL